MTSIEKILWYCDEGAESCSKCLIREYCAECEGNFGYLDGETIDKLIQIIGERDDKVNHPKHYCRKDGIECIDEMLEIFGVKPVMTYCLLNVWKYRYRAAEKNGTEDLRKSDWYMHKYIELKKREEEW